MRVAITFTLMAALAHWLLSPEGVKALGSIALFVLILWRLNKIYEPTNEVVDPGHCCADSQDDWQDI